jgi:pyruvate kinase
MKLAAKLSGVPTMHDAAALLTDLDTLIESVAADAGRILKRWKSWDIRDDFDSSAENLAAYLALRHHDIRPMQRSLMSLGLSSLGRLESRVFPTLDAVRGALAAINGGAASPLCPGRFFAGEKRLRERSIAMFGRASRPRPAALLVTCPSEAASDPGFILELARRGVEAVRINCAHDAQEDWLKMIGHVEEAAHRTGHRMQIFMDIAGPKIRTGAIRHRRGHKHVHVGDRIAMVVPGALGKRLPSGVALAFECTLPEAVSAARAGQAMLIDDGKIVTRIEAKEDGVVMAVVTRCDEEGARIKREKGINLPDTELGVAALTDKDREDLAFIAAHADAVEFSFVQSGDDVAMLQQALAEIRPDDWHQLSLILKIETARAVRNLPEILVRAAARQPVAIMIARGDLALEIGFVRLAEIQEEILWIAEAAQVPVIWATQVLEHLVKEGLPNRGELTDAAMAVRAECVMLNKGPYLLEAVDALDKLLSRMGDHVQKKTPRLRQLMSW